MGGAFVALGLLAAPAYYYHYTGFMAPFVALIVSSLVGRMKKPVSRLISLRSLFFPKLLALPAASAAIALLLAASVVEVASLPAAPQVGDTVSDAIPGHGCILYANPTLALLTIASPQT